MSAKTINRKVNVTKMMPIRPTFSALAASVAAGWKPGGEVSSGMNTELSKVKLLYSRKNATVQILRNFKDFNC